MIQILDKYGNTSTDDGKVIIIDKYGNVKKTGGGGAVWGSITGTITAQTDLITYLSTNYQAALEKRHDFVYPYDYCGTAPNGTLDSAPVWTIYRIQTDVITPIVLSATGAWTDRYILIYT